jgi:hypothetical protein
MEEEALEHSCEVCKRRIAISALAQCLQSHRNRIASLLRSVSTEQTVLCVHIMWPLSTADEQNAEGRRHRSDISISSAHELASSFEKVQCGDERQRWADACARACGHEYQRRIPRETERGEDEALSVADSQQSNDHHTWLCVVREHRRQRSAALAAQAQQ